MRPCVTSIFTTLCENVSCNLARFGKDARMPVSHSLRQQLEKLDQQIVDLTALAGNYVMVAMLLAMAEETVPPDKQEPFKPGEPSTQAPGKPVSFAVSIQ